MRWGCEVNISSPATKLYTDYTNSTEPVVPVDSHDAAMGTFRFCCNCGRRFYGSWYEARGEAIRHFELDHADRELRMDLDALEDAIAQAIVPDPYFEVPETKHETLSKEQQQARALEFRRRRAEARQPFKALPEYSEATLRREAQKLFEYFKEDEPEESNRAERGWLIAFNQACLKEPVSAERIDQILSEEHAKLNIKVTAIPERKVESSTPRIPEEAFYGIAGRIIDKLRPNTESHPMGNLLEFLTCFGNIVGATAYYQVEDTKHFTNISVVTVGKSSKARKGTGTNRVNRIASALDQDWFNKRRTSGLGSGEIVISLVRDRQIGPVKKKNGDIVIEVTDEGVDDKRLFVSEGEFAGILAVGNRKDNVLSKVIRDAWDHLPIRNMAKGGSAVCMNPHISISANITQEELLLLMREADKFNGFGNRFLWCYVERQSLLPHGGEELDWSEELQQLNKAVEFGKARQRVFMDRNARLMWQRIYEDLSDDVGGLVGAVTSRGEAQVVRLALIFSVLDCSEHITVDHLKAAKAVWDYCEQSATYIFGGVNKDQHKLLNFLFKGSKSIARIREDLYKRHRTVSEIQADIQRLIEIGRVVELTDENGRPVYSPVRG